MLSRCFLVARSKLGRRRPLENRGTPECLQSGEISAAVWSTVAGIAEDDRVSFSSRCLHCPDPQQAHWKLFHVSFIYIQARRQTFLFKTDFLHRTRKFTADVRGSRSQRARSVQPRTTRFRVWCLRWGDGGGRGGVVLFAKSTLWNSVKEMKSDTKIANSKDAKNSWSVFISLFFPQSFPAEDALKKFT